MVATDDTRSSVPPYLAGKHGATVEVLVWAFRTGRQLESWLSDILSTEGFDTSEFTALVALWTEGSSRQLSAGELADRLVQTTGGTTKTIRRMEERGLVKRVDDPRDRRRALIELTPHGLETAPRVLEAVLDAFDLDIGELDIDERSELSSRLARLSEELDDRLRRR